MTRQVLVGNVPIGGGARVSVQSMTNTDTRDVQATLSQIRRLYEAGCDIVRVSVYDEACAEAVKELVSGSPVPLVADIHFDHRLAIRSIENGIAKVRINPGNIGGEDNVRRLADCVKTHHVPVRVGVNAGSLEKELLRKHGGPTAEALAESALNQARMLEGMGVQAIVLSMKASSVRTTVDVYRLVAACSDYPLHLGVTEAGTPEAGTVKSAVGIGSLLLDGIGDTIRVSLSGPPELEVPVCLDILRAVGLRTEGVEIISCPTCGRTCIDVAGIADQIRRETRAVKRPLKVAVMGCVVNGPGEAREADIGVAGGRDGGALFVKGEPPGR
jgi:(E)-4-hydroxy-3-methylbut-2-enyl-diphosphate synthase